MKLLRLGFAISLLAATTATNSASASAAPTPQSQILTLLNQARASHGLVALRTDSRLGKLATERAADMAAADVLSHTVGGSLGSGLASRRIQWFGHGEVIAYTGGSSSAAPARLFQLWASSPSHWDLLMSGSFNYLGIGLARSDSGRTYGAIVMTESRDRTGARSTMVKATVSGDDVRWTWRGSDVPLQRRTAGLRDFAVQQRTDRGGWVTVSTGTTSTARSAVNRARGHWYGLRVRARDRVGNVGPWTPELRVWVP